MTACLQEQKRHQRGFAENPKDGYVATSNGRLMVQCGCRFMPNQTLLPAAVWILMRDHPRQLQLSPLFDHDCAGGRPTISVARQSHRPGSMAIVRRSIASAKVPSG